MIKKTLLVIISASISCAVAATKSNVTVIIADDLGYKDLGLQDSEVEISQLVNQSKGTWSLSLRNALLVQMRAEMLSELKVSGNKVAPETVDWVDSSTTAQQAVYGSVYPTDPRILVNLDQLRSELGPALFEKYGQFCIAAAVARRSVGVGEIAHAAVNLKFAKIYEWGDLARKEDQDPAKWLAERSAEPKETLGGAAVKGYLKANSLSAKEAYESEVHRKKLEQLLAKAGVKKPERSLPGALHLVMLDAGQRPTKRSNHPRVSDYLKFLDSINTVPASELPLTEDQKWPLYPIQKAPWPMMMPLSMTWPLDEAEYIWQKFQGKTGGKRHHTYGPYNRFPKGVDNSLDRSKWHWSAWPSVITTGGLCGTMSSIANGTYTSLGVPILKAGQPGHSCIVRYDVNSKGEFSAGVGQSATGGPDKTTAPWLFADGQQVRSRGKYSVYSEYHYGLAQAMNVGLASYMDTRMALNCYKTLSEEIRGSVGRKLVLSALEKNPSNIEAWYVLARDSSSGSELATLLESFDQQLQVDAMIEHHTDRDASSDLGEDKESSKQSVTSKVATLHHIGLEQMTELGLRDIDRFSNAGLQLVIDQLTRLIEAGNEQLIAMRDRCRCKLDGPEAVQAEVAQSLHKFLKNPPKGRKQAKRVSSQLGKRISVVAAASEARQQREQWLRQLAESFSPKQKVVVSKKKGKQLDKFYSAVSAELVNSLKSKPANKKALREIKQQHDSLLKS